MIVILTINGKGNRFLEAGIKTPKFLLPYKNSTVIANIVNNFKTGFPQGARFVIGLNITYKEHAPYLIDLFRNHQLQHELVFLEDTKGQADTVRVIIEETDLTDQPMWIVNCDTLVSNTWTFMYPNADIVVETFESDSILYSYIDNLNKVAKIAEKKVISHHASTGNYYFSSTKTFQELCTKTKYKKEIFISDVIQCGVENKLNVIGTHVPSRSVTILGTPAQYDQNIQS